MKLPQPYSLFLRLYCRHGRRTCFYDPATACGQDLLQLQGFPASAAHTGREVLHEMPGVFRIKAKGLPALHVADGWHCQFLEADLKTPLPKELTLPDPGTLIPYGSIPYAPLLSVSARNAAATTPALRDGRLLSTRSRPDVAESG